MREYTGVAPRTDEAFWRHMLSFGGTQPGGGDLDGDKYLVFHGRIADCFPQVRPAPRPLDDIESEIPRDTAAEVTVTQVVEDVRLLHDYFKRFDESLVGKITTAYFEAAVSTSHQEDGSTDERIESLGAYSSIAMDAGKRNHHSSHYTEFLKTKATDRRAIREKRPAWYRYNRAGQFADETLDDFQLEEFLSPSEIPTSIVTPMLKRLVAIRSQTVLVKDIGGVLDPLLCLRPTPYCIHSPPASTLHLLKLIAEIYNGYNTHRWNREETLRAFRRLHDRNLELRDKMIRLSEAPRDEADFAQYLFYWIARWWNRNKGRRGTAGPKHPFNLQATGVWEGITMLGTYDLCCKVVQRDDIAPPAKQRRFGESSQHRTDWYPAVVICLVT